MLEKDQCHDCDCLEGELHSFGCDMERCPFCGDQLISCGCVYHKLGFPYDLRRPTNGLPRKIYKNGLPDDLVAKWHEILVEKGRVPYIAWPNVCAKCGIMNPKMFIVPNDEWEYYIQIRRRAEILCQECYEQVKAWIDDEF